MSTKNYPHAGITCTECKSTEVLYDSFHDITYCEKCGTVIIDNQFSSIVQYIRLEKSKESYIRSLWKK